MSIDERKTIVRWLREYRPYGSDLSTDRVEQCEHECYGWESCDDCTIDRIADGIERGEHIEFKPAIQK